MNTNWNDPNFQGFGRQPRPKRERHAVGTPVGRTLLNIAVTLVFAAVYFYVVLPPISLKSEDFYVFVLLVCAVYGGCAILTSGFQGTGVKGYFGFLKKQCTVPLVVAAALVVTALVGAVIGWQLFRAGDYRDLSDASIIMITAGIITTTTRTTATTTAKPSPRTTPRSLREPSASPRPRSASPSSDSSPPRISWSSSSRPSTPSPPRSS